MARQYRNKISLSELTLDIDPKKYDIDKFDFSEIEDYVQALSSGRKYQFDAIRQIMVYLWGGRYESIEDLARRISKRRKPFARDLPPRPHFFPRFLYRENFPEYAIWPPEPGNPM